MSIDAMKQALEALRDAADVADADCTCEKYVGEALRRMAEELEHKA